jgi:hypothetical protein
MKQQKARQKMDQYVDFASQCLYLMMSLERSGEEPTNRSGIKRIGLSISPMLSKTDRNYEKNGDPGNQRLPVPSADSVTLPLWTSIIQQLINKTSVLCSDTVNMQLLKRRHSDA